MKRISALITLFMTTGLFAQGALDVYDREATREEEYGQPDISKEEMEVWPMHPDEPRDQQRQVEDEEEEKIDETQRKERKTKMKQVIIEE